MERGFGLYSSQFAVLAAGGFFLPIDPANPDEHVKYLLADSGAQCIVADSRMARRIENLQLDIQVVEFEPNSAVDDLPANRTAHIPAWPQRSGLYDLYVRLNR